VLQGEGEKGVKRGRKKGGKRGEARVSAESLGEQGLGGRGHQVKASSRKERKEQIRKKGGGECKNQKKHHR